MANPIYNVLFLCTGNSARSIMAEAIMGRVGKDRFRAFSAGSKPSGKVADHTLTLLSALGYETSDFRSKSWDEFAAPDAPTMDFIFTVCDEAAGETCPVWPGHPANGHWSIPDPVKVSGGHAEVSAAYDEAYRMLSNRITALVNLPIDKLDHAALHHHLDQIAATA